MRSVLKEALEGNWNNPPKYDQGDLLDDDAPTFPIIPTKEPIVRKKKVAEIDTVQDVKDDYEFTREVSLNMLEQQQELIKGMVAFLNSCPSARGYEVMNAMVKTAQDMCKDMLEMQKQIKELTWEPPVEEDEEKKDGDTYYIFNGPSEVLDAIDSNAIDITPKKLEHEQQ